MKSMFKKINSTYNEFTQQSNQNIAPNALIDKLYANGTYYLKSHDIIFIFNNTNEMPYSMICTDQNILIHAIEQIPIPYITDHAEFYGKYGLSFTINITELAKRVQYITTILDLDSLIWLFEKIITLYYAILTNSIKFNKFNTHTIVLDDISQIQLDNIIDLLKQGFYIEHSDIEILYATNVGAGIKNSFKANIQHLPNIIDTNEKTRANTETSFDSLSINDLEYVDVGFTNTITTAQRIGTDLTKFSIFVKTPLTQLYLSHNQITDISPLRLLINLTVLNLEDNQIKDISPLLSLHNLLILNLGKNYIENISKICFLTKLMNLNISNNYIKDLSPIESLKFLEYLDITNHDLSDDAGQIKINELRTTAKHIKHVPCGMHKFEANIASAKQINPYINTMHPFEIEDNKSPQALLFSMQSSITELNISQTLANIGKTITNKFT